MKKFLLTILVILAIVLLGIGIAQEHEKNQKYKSDLEFLKTIDDPFFAKNAADRIKVGVSAGEISYKELGLQNESQLDELVLKAWGKEAKRHLEWMETVGTYHEANQRAENIRAAVAADATSWEELGTNESELNRLALEAFKREAKDDLAVLRTSGSTYQAQMRAQNIKDAVAANATSWEELDVNESELLQLVLDAQGREAQKDLAFLKEIDCPELFSGVAESIEQAVNDGAITWEELKTDKSELYKIIETNRTQTVSSILLFTSVYCL